MGAFVPAGSEATAAAKYLAVVMSKAIAVEAESFISQERTEKRRWYVTSKSEAPEVSPDGDPPHFGGASGGAYLEILPDTRRTHDDKLIAGENFSNKPGEMAVLTGERQRAQHHRPRSLLRLHRRRPSTSSAPTLSVSSRSR